MIHKHSAELVETGRNYLTTTKLCVSNHCFVSWNGIAKFSPNNLM